MVTRGAGLASKGKSNQTENQVLLQNDLMLTYKLWPTLHCIPNISRNLSANSGLPELDTCSKIQNLLAEGTAMFTRITQFVQWAVMLSQ